MPFDRRQEKNACLAALRLIGREEADAVDHVPSMAFLG
jgi:hypothetical protein